MNALYSLPKFGKKSGKLKTSRPVVHPLGVIPKPRAFTSGARDLPEYYRLVAGGRSLAPPEKRLR